ncbi:hypothetical protein A3H65_01170 [Candidatus Giovannonibacteria bacterium RIFCSPLOWO2_02_FULL_45_14]|uniref:Uncharacterized protein n=1 Tax=Candidatus Giovannonibacteria bacterium RIFCSPLOWO2_12_FULL_44_15 TaxID=1798364 RepID=A0A1F5XZX2_9BACT|nr:MAG: hypothetical protein A3C75_01345 [Candidatus Giovannonibacteria bacterium RIFCSPHIGHO2_02_FULL_44_31]OGF90951.1 MAG: hypothetical protein A3H65_01170 [Candidatus Giovannonibacteria bacterium RIFCSPLOWO2_02_FULL_45_14]OGF93468.1 MAG: hypothetical protein A3G54_04230 [Candidatus Giovannonibacteria bacterium RIFCSPLOWO2_12_FULL_44_15]
MITDVDIKKLTKVLATKEDVRQVHADLVGHDMKFDKITKALNEKPDRDEFPQLLDKIFEYTALKIEHDHMKKVIREKLGVEI